MAVTPAPMSANQTAYLNGLVKAGGGNAEWAKAQLGAVPAPTAAPVPAKSVFDISPDNLTKLGETYKANLAAGRGVPYGGNTAPAPKPQGTFNPSNVAGDSQPPATPVAAGQSTPAPMSQGSYPGQLTNAQIAAEAQARIDKQRAAITEATNAANAARKNVFDYTNQITGDSRTLENGAFNETHNPFTGQTGYAQAQLQRNRSIQDTANNNNYQADITANNQKVTDFETLAPEQQQAILDGLTRQERDYGLQVGTLTGQFNGQNTMQQNQNNFNNGIAQGNLTGNYTGPVGSQGQGMMNAQGNPQGQQGMPTLAAKAQSFNQDQQNWQDRFNYGQAVGQFGNGQQTLAGQTAMAQLTGKMPDGTPTNAAQQQQLQNQWTLAEQTGTIPNTLADFYGLPHGMQTQAAKNQAAQLGISQQNATNSANSTSNSNNNAKINQLMEVWKNTGVAPAGLESVGVKQGDKYTGGNPSSTGNFNLDDYKGHINSVFYSNEPSDPNDPLSPKTKVFDKAAAQKYVDSLNLPKDQKNQLYQIYGLQAVSDSDISQYLK